MAALLPPCVHLPDPNEYALCSLFSISRAWPSPFTPVTSFPLPCMVHSLHQHHLTYLLVLPHPPPSPSLYVLLHGLWPRRLAWHWPPTPQDHSGTLGAEEFKACLISLGFDIANDAQVLKRSHTPTVKGLTSFFLLLFCTFPLPCISILPPILSLFSPLLLLPPVYISVVISHVGFPSKIYFLQPLILPITFSAVPATPFLYLSTPPGFVCSSLTL